jgi:hypothetical protein
MHAMLLRPVHPERESWIGRRLTGREADFLASSVLIEDPLHDLIGGGGTCNRVAQALHGAEMVAIVLHSLEDYIPMCQTVRGRDGKAAEVKVYGRG